MQKDISKPIASDVLFFISTHATYHNSSCVRYTATCCTAVSRVDDGKNQLNKSDYRESSMDPDECALKNVKLNLKIIFRTCVVAYDAVKLCFQFCN